MLLAAGTCLGPYEVLSTIGSGGMGEVYKALDSRLDRIVAVKVSQARFSERFEREARAIAALNHPHICQIHDVGPNYLVMEFIEGAPLKGPLLVEKAIEYAAQILDALDAAHRKGITHRDLKPANILVTKQGIKLLDFGLAKHAASGDATLTIPNAVMGTPAYMAPEQWEGKQADARSDIFAFGCVLYEMLTGKLAAKERIPVQPAALESVLETCLEKDPEDRWQSARDIKRALSLPAATAVESRRAPWIPIAAAILVTAIIVGWAVSRFRQPPTDERLFRLQIDPPEGGRFIFGASTGGGIAMSPDGRTAAFMASGNGGNGLWIRPLDSTTARLLPGTEGASYPFWSPDNKSIAFFTTGKLERVDLAGGSPLAICDVAPQGRGGAWSSDGKILFGTVASGLFQVSASGGTPTPLTFLDAAHNQGGDRFPQVLPGGRFLYYVQSDTRENSGIYAASLSKPAERVRLLDADSNALYAPANNGKSYLLWFRGETLFAQEFDARALKLAGEPHSVLDPVAENALSGQMNAAVSASGLLLYSGSNTSSQFAWIDRAGKSLGVVGEPGEYSTFRLSPDGRRAAVARDRSRGSDLWVLEAERGVFSRFTSSPAVNNYPIWSPDGRTIVYQRSGHTRVLFRKDSDGAGSEQSIAQSLNLQDSTDWSRDGRFVLYYEVDPHTQRDLWILPVTPDGKPAPGTQPKPYLRTPFNESWGRFSPEASPRWVAYQSDESGRYEIYIQAFPEPRGATRISTGGGQFPEWGPDGRELFYVSPNYKLMAVSLKLGAGSVQPSAPRELFPLPVDDIGFSPYETAPDGQRFLVRATPQQAAKPLTVIVNWPALLKK